MVEMALTEKRGLVAASGRHQYCWCEPCRMTVQVPFAMIRKSRPMLSAMDFAELGTKMRCRRCGAAPARFKPYRQSDEPGFTAGFPRPGQSREP